MFLEFHVVNLRKRGEEVRQFILENVHLHPTDIVTSASQHFDISRQAVSKHVRSLVVQGSLNVSGRTKNRRYSLAPLIKSQFAYGLDGTLKEDVVWTKDISQFFVELPENVMRIWQHGLTEMLNNAIDHSGGTVVQILVEKTAVTSQIIIHDNGEGIFKKIKRELHLDDEKHAPLELGKGKFTTDPERHSGEGIFFTSRMLDYFMIMSHKILFSHEFNAREDWIGEHNQVSQLGTVVFMKMRNNSARTLNQVFQEFTTGDLRFSKTVVPVWLAQYGNDKLVSRSQAKRLLAGMEKFEMVVFDFANVEYIGQGFADEIFRVFAKQHPHIKIETIHTNEDVLNMVKRVTHSDHQTGIYVS